MPKYIVNLTKHTTKTVVVEADNLEEADRKLMQGDVLFATERQDNADVYDGWAYEDTDNRRLTRDLDSEVICDLEGFARWFSGEGVEHLERNLFKCTECGMSYTNYPDRIVLVGCVEGADCDGPSTSLYYPFRVVDAERAMANLEWETAIAWHEWNDVNEEE